MNMKTHNTLEELLEAHTKWVLKFQNLGIGQYKSDLDKTFLASNCLALGKPEPLVKNKQTKEYCPFRKNEECIKPSSCKAFGCNKPL